MILGAHMSISNGFAQAVQDSVAELDCKAMQIFLKSPRGGVAKPLSEAEELKFQQAYDQHNFQFVVGHSSYLLNLAKPIDILDNWQMNSLLDDFEKLSRLNGKGLVYHVGKYLKLPYQEAEGQLVENLKILLDKAHKYNVPLLLENCAGQGTEMGTNLEHLQSVIDKVQAGKLLATCLDTCHAFAAGYDLSDPAEVDKFFDQIQKTITIQKVVCFHFNDSKNPCGSRKDRHENLGLGHIAVPGLQQFLKRAAEHNVPVILETPLINNSHLPDVKLVRSWV